MADQVNPLGGLTPGANQAIPSTPVPSRPATPSPSKASAPAGGKESVQAEHRAATKEGLEAAAKSVEGFLEQAPSDLRFMVDKTTGQYYFKVVDSRTHETIRQVPSEEVMAMARRLHEMADPKGATGVIVDAEG